jgi:hypothetical protein
MEKRNAVMTPRQQIIDWNITTAQELGWTKLVVLGSGASEREPILWGLTPARKVFARVPDFFKLNTEIALALGWKLSCHIDRFGNRFYQKGEEFRRVGAVPRTHLPLPNYILILNKMPIKKK